MAEAASVKHPRASNEARRNIRFSSVPCHIAPQSARALCSAVRNEVSKVYSSAPLIASAAMGKARQRKRFPMPLCYHFVIKHSRDFVPEFAQLRTAPLLELTALHPRVLAGGLE